MEAVIDGNFCSGLFVYTVHVRVKCWAVAIVIVIAIRDKKEGVDHLVQEGLNEILARSKFQEWDTKPAGVKKARPIERWQKIMYLETANQMS